ncbi:nickel/cobalt transporter [Rhizobium halophytocola]|uniref:Nickel/cobalt efflux system n=1 Tax=Rhizobium halophytocola TaxID=735519 RepID=A0ABS4DTP0_9HYPH|nr:nickel/cobalt transporter [Rhizobium halophytocola]MBP1848989.1 nickel/cobalt exporter [Rhizobium halophytocola]
MRLPPRLRLALIASLGLAVFAGIAHARSPLGVGTAEPSFDTTGLFGSLLVWVNYYQQAFYRQLTGALVAMRQDPAKLWLLIGLSFAYGIFHAAGPGHGKAVVSSYLLANETQLRRGIAISFIASLLQAVVAIGVVAGAYLLLRGSGITLTQATNAMEIASYCLVIAFGAWLLVRKLKGLVFVRQGDTASALFGTSGVSTRTTQATGLSFSAIEIGHDHQALQAGAVCADCGMTHLPDPSLLQADRFGLGEVASAIVAVGLRPCSGALLVMTFSLLNGLYLGGILSVFAMALGTTITVSLLAILAVGAKGLATRLAGRQSRSGAMVGHAIEITGAIAVIALGTLLLLATLKN